MEFWAESCLMGLTLDRENGLQTDKTYFPLLTVQRSQTHLLKYVFVGERLKETYSKCATAGSLGPGSNC